VGVSHQISVSVCGTEDATVLCCFRASGLIAVLLASTVLGYGDDRFVKKYAMMKVCKRNRVYSQDKNFFVKTMKRSLEDFFFSFYLNRKVLVRETTCEHKV